MLLEMVAVQTYRSGFSCHFAIRKDEEYLLPSSECPWNGIQPIFSISVHISFGTLSVLFLGGDGVTERCYIKIRRYRRILGETSRVQSVA